MKIVSWRDQLVAELERTDGRMGDGRKTAPTHSAAAASHAGGAHAVQQANKR
jgi:hypothetical protein